MRNDRILYLLDIDGEDDELCVLVNRLIDVTREDEISYDYLNSLVCDIRDRNKVSIDKLFKSFVQYPYYRIYNEYCKVSDYYNNGNYGYFIFKSENGYELDSFIQDSDYIDTYIKDALYWDKRVSISKLIEILSRINIHKKKFNLVDLAKEIAVNCADTSCKVLSYIEDVYEIMCTDNGDIRNYYIVEKDGYFGIEVVNK